MPKTKTKYTYDDYAAMDDDKRYELIEGYYMYQRLVFITKLSQ